MREEKNSGETFLWLRVRIEISPGVRKRERGKEEREEKTDEGEAGDDHDQQVMR